MKKFIIALVFVIGFVSCTKDYLENTQDEKVSKVSFTIDIFKNGIPITKALDNADIIDAIKLGIPKYYNLKITNIDNNNVYYLTTDKEITLPNGTYEVVTWNFKDKNGDKIRWDSKKQSYNDHFGHRCDDNFLYMKSSGGVILCNSPKISISETIEIKNDGAISLNGTIESAALVWDSEIIKNIEISCEVNSSLGADLKCYVKKDNVCVTFHDKHALDIVVYPYENTNYEKKKFTIPEQLTLGNYYIIKLDEVTNSTNDVNVSLGEFTSGGTL